ncbi:MAG: eukaryotic-like serine/threonine-protein kinase [Miltoncostaeaceae bacterium]|jgi:serine/threonine-protein kinase|nr:eukaryotic-like serine/threonine-protein kinase [Miltoncostaeaceae bacterium]
MGFEPGMTINERYELGRQLGAGGMARVFLAHDRLLDREVAVKVLFDRYAADPSFVERFRREASAAAGLNHPNIVAVYDRGEADDTYYIVMEYLAGPDLKEVIRRRAPLPPGEAVDYALQILAALGAAHRRDVIHRDVKPQNVMVAEDGHLKVTDFGIARAGAQTEMTEVGSVIGTAQYLSPEQARGDDVTAASDCYAVGIVLYEMLTGRVPFDGERPMTVAMKQVNEPPVPPRIYEPGVPIELDAVVLKALAKRPGDRYRTAEEFRGALLDIRGSLEGGTAMTRAFAAAPATAATRVMPQAPPPPPPPPRTARTRVAPIPPEEPPRRRRMLPVILWLIALLVIGGLAAVYLLRGGDQVTVPSLQGLNLAQAQAQLDQAGLVGDSVPVEAEADDGTVVSTDPPAGTKVDEGSTVTLRVSSGPGTVPVPDVTGDKLARARERLRDAGFTVGDVNEEAAEQEKGTVIRQDPGPNTQAEADATVTLTVSTGPEQATVPDVTGGSVDDARAELADADLTVGDVVDQEDPSSPEGQVINQSPSPGEKVDTGTAVTLTVAAAAPEQSTVPSVIGLSGGDAQATLEQAGFVVISQGAYSDQPEDTVIEQVPAAGTPAAPNSQVRFTFSLGPAPPGEGTDTTGGGGQ